MRGVLVSGMAIGLLTLSAACGSGAPTSSAAASSGGAAGNPKDDGYACALLTKSQITSVTGGPPKEGTHLMAIVANGEVLTSCTVYSVKPCPQNLPHDSPYCHGSYQLEWTVDVYDDQAAAMAAFEKAKPEAGTPVVDIGADQAVQDQQPRSLAAIKGKALIHLDYIAPGGVSGNPAVLPTAPPTQGRELHRLARMILTRVR